MADIIEYNETRRVKVDLAECQNTFQELKGRYKNLPELKKFPDEETLNYYNADMYIRREMEQDYIKRELADILTKLREIKEAGLLPARYADFEDKIQNFLSKL